MQMIEMMLIERGVEKLLSPLPGARRKNEWTSAGRKFKVS